MLAGWCRFIQVDPRGKEFGLALIQYWIDRGFFSWLRQRFLSGSQLMQQYVYLALIPFQLAAGTPAETSPWMTHAVSSFCTQLMSLPMHTLLESNSIVLEYWYKQWPLEAIIKHLFLQNQTVLDSSLSTDILVIQGYRSTAYANALVQFIDGIQKRWDRVQCWAFPLQLAMVMAICSFLPFVDADWIHEKTENMDEEEEEDEVEAQQQSSMMKLPKDPHNLQSLSQLDNTQWFEMIFRRAPVTLDVKSLIALSRISLICQPRLANTQAFFINSWLIRPQWIRQLWDISRENQLFQCAKQADPRVLGGFDVLAECFQNEALRDSWILLLQLTEVLRRLLMTYGKDEFYGDENILGVTGFTELTSVLKFVVVFMYLKQDLQMSVFSDLMAVQDARKSIGQLLQQIHVRNCAKQFCMNEVFHVESLVELDQLRTALHAALGAPELNDETQSSPYVQILFNIPFVIPFNDRVVLFRDFVENDARSFARQDRIRVRIHRDHVFEDSMAQLNELASRLRHQIQITFISELGYEEAGIDGGGVFKEFLSVLSRQAFDPNLGLFSFTHEQLLYPNPHSYSKQNSQLAQFEFLGRIMGKALYEGILIEASFAIFFLNKWLGRNNYLDDLASLDPELYKNLMFLKNYEGNVEDLALNFTITSEGKYHASLFQYLLHVVAEFGETKSIELFPNGKETPVTNENRIRYIFLVTNYKLNVQIGLQCRAFLSGLSDLIQPKWLQIFNQYELHILVSGSDVPIDLNDLRRNTVYSEDYNETNSTIAMFWRVVSTFSEGDKRKLVKFVTSCPRPPLLGFKELCPKFSIRRAEDNQDRVSYLGVFAYQFLILQLVTDYLYLCEFAEATAL